MQMVLGAFNVIMLWTRTDIKWHQLVGSAMCPLLTIVVDHVLTEISCRALMCGRSPQQQRQCESYMPVGEACLIKGSNHKVFQMSYTVVAYF
mgnify:CR=1 FL=1